ncbi:hypothetical protein [Rubinisphaera sp.]|uniref:hypothetical protein n=1 Tax=Rubinisphaera sp. TaxID=2024857 RepID=UPI0025F9E904|nr:hypothetical protein [Rubinisphaera sp.]
MAIYGPLVIDKVVSKHRIIADECRGFENGQDFEGGYAVYKTVQRSIVFGSIAILLYKHNDTTAKEYIEELLADQKVGKDAMSYMELNIIRSHEQRKEIFTKRYSKIFNLD